MMEAPGRSTHLTMGMHSNPYLPPPEEIHKFTIDLAEAPSLNGKRLYSQNSQKYTTLAPEGAKIHKNLYRVAQLGSPPPLKLTHFEIFYGHNDSSTPPPRIEGRQGGSWGLRRNTLTQFPRFESNVVCVAVLHPRFTSLI